MERISFSKIALAMVISLFRCSTGYGHHDDYIFKQTNEKPLGQKVMYISQPNLEIRFLEDNVVISKEKSLQLSSENLNFIQSFKEAFDSGILYFNDTLFVMPQTMRSGKKVEVNLNSKKFFGAFFINKECVFAKDEFFDLTGPTEMFGSDNSRSYEVKLSDNVVKEVNDGDEVVVYQTCSRFDNIEHIAWSLILSRKKF